MNDKVFDFVVNAVRTQEAQRYEDERSRDPVSLTSFTVVLTASSLIKPSRTKAAHHREREQVYVKKLEEAEKELREKGVSVEVYDQAAGNYLSMGSITSGSLTSYQQNFQPRIDQMLLDAVKRAKEKMLGHRDKAEKFEQYARAFTCNPDQLVRLTVADVTYFGLGD